MKRRVWRMFYFNWVVKRTFHVFRPLTNSSRPSDRYPIDLTYNPSLVELPPAEVMDEIANLYFIHCHNQPYSVFHEPSFKMKLQAGQIAPEIQYCMLGMALRYPFPPIPTSSHTV